MKRNKSTYLKLICSLVVASFLLSLMVVWINLKVIDLSYSIQRLEREFRDQRELKEKLTIELSNLTSRKRLLELAKKYRLKVPDIHRIRRIDVFEQTPVHNMSKQGKKLENAKK